jgi:hypothetical protein
LEQGALPVYPVDDSQVGAAMYALRREREFRTVLVDGEPVIRPVGLVELWETRTYSHNGRAILPSNIDMKVTDVCERIDGWLDQIRNDPFDGCLVFAIRWVEELDGERWAEASLAFLPGTLGISLEGADPAELIRQVCRNGWIDNPHPIVEQSIRECIWIHEDMRRWLRQHSRTRFPDNLRCDERARLLLYEALGIEQIADLEETGGFNVDVDGDIFRIDTKWAHNIHLMDGDKKLVNYCITANNLPVYDIMLAQKLLLETNQEEFFRIANSRELPQEPVLDLWPDDLIPTEEGTAADRAAARELQAIIRALPAVEDALPRIPEFPLGRELRPEGPPVIRPNPRPRPRPIDVFPRLDACR